MKRFTILAGAVALLVFGGQITYGCSCRVPTASEIESLSEAEFARRFADIDGAAFTGRVVEAGRVKTELRWVNKFTFEVESYWAGPGAKRIDIQTAAHGASCGVSYAVGKKYLVFAVRHGGVFHANLCTHIGATKNRKVILRRLGRGEKPK